MPPRDGPTDVRQEGSRSSDSARQGSVAAAEVGLLVTKLLSGGAVVVVLLWFLFEVRRGVLLLLLALIVASVLNVPVTALERRKLSRRVATLVVLAGTLLAAGLLGWLILPRLATEVPRLLELLPELASELVERTGSLAGESPELQRQLSLVVGWALETVRGVWRYATTGLEALVGGIIVVALVLFMLLDPRPMLSTYLRFFPERRRDSAARAFARSSRMVAGWVTANVIVGGIRGIAAYFFLVWLGVPGALLWGVLSVVTALIPRVGFYLMTIPPVVVAAAISFEAALWTALFFIVMDEFLGNFVAPRIYGETMELHAAYILGMTVLLGLAFGLVGVLIAAPLAGIIKAYFDEFYLADRPEDDRSAARVEAMLRGDDGGKAVGG